eukprot:755316-Hanusia_phi.AAC.1
MEESERECSFFSACLQDVSDIFVDSPRFLELYSRKKSMMPTYPPLLLSFVPFSSNPCLASANFILHFTPSPAYST